MGKNLKIICLSAPLIIYAVSLILAYFIYSEPVMWYEDDREEGIAFSFNDLFYLYGIASILLLPSWLNLSKRIRESELLSFLSFFWAYCLVFIFFAITAGHPFAGLFIIAMWGGFVYTPVLIIYYIIFRIIINKTMLKNREEADLP